MSHLTNASQARLQREMTALREVSLPGANDLMVCLGCLHPGTWDEILEHVATCADHPIGSLEADRAELVAAGNAMADLLEAYEEYGEGRREPDDAVIRWRALIGEEAPRDRDPG